MEGSVSASAAVTQESRCRLETPIRYSARSAPSRQVYALAGKNHSLSAIPFKG